MHVVTYEDRPYDTVGLKLLLLSLIKHCPGLPIDVIFPSAHDSLIRWVTDLPDVTLHSGAELKHKGYNVKPSVLLNLLNRGVDQAIWLDTDIIVTKDFRPFLSSIPANHFVVTQEWFGAPYQGGSFRSKAWAFKVGRNLSDTTNTSAIRVTQQHYALLHAWDNLLNDPTYIEAQNLHWSKRPIHLLGDQELLSALLEATDFADVPVTYIKRGRDIAHCFQHQGYAFHQMVFNLISGNRPYFVHGQGAKPWREDKAFRTYLDLSTYTLCTKEYCHGLDENTDWLCPKSAAGKFFRGLFRDNPWLSGVPLAFFEEAKNQRILRTNMKKILGRP